MAYDIVVKTRGNGKIIAVLCQGLTWEAASRIVRNSKLNREYWDVCIGTTPDYYVDAVLSMCYECMRQKR